MYRIIDLEKTSMRSCVFLIALTTSSILIGCTNQQPQPAAQAPQPAAAAAPAAPAGQPQGDLRQVMRGILFPNANVIFYGQDKNPADVKPAKDPALATDPLASAYGGWTA